jgi:hypothetical protein
MIHLQLSREDRSKRVNQGGTDKSNLRLEWLETLKISADSYKRLWVFQLIDVILFIEWLLCLVWLALRRQYRGLKYFSAFNKRWFAV